MLADLRTQVNIIAALTIRDLQGLQKQYNYGFAWALLEPLMFIAVLRLAKAFLKGLTPDGLPPTTFIVLGIIPNYMFLNAMQAVMKAVGDQDKMLLFPRVTPMDIGIASALRSFCIYFLLFWVFLGPSSIIEGAWPPQNILEVMFALFSLLTFGIALGFVFGSVRRVFPPIRQFVSYYTLANRMIGGMMFVITQIPSIYWPYLTWNPILHCSEMTRDGWFVQYTSPIASPTYVLEWILGMLLLGLSLERFVRRIPYI